MGKFSRHNRRSSKVTGDDVLNILAEYKAGTTQGALARKYGLTIGSIGRIVRGETHQQLTVGRIKSDDELKIAAAESLERLKLMHPELFPTTPETIDPPPPAVAERFADDLAKAVELNNELEGLKKC